MQIKVVCVNGFPESGKTTFIQMCIANSFSATIHSISTVDRAKEALRLLGWNGGKTEVARGLLHNLKMISNQHFDGAKAYVAESVGELESRMKHLHKGFGILFVDCREPGELALFREIFDANALLIRRPGERQDVKNAADQGVLDYKGYTHVIWNEGSLDDLREHAREFVAAQIKHMEEKENGSSFNHSNRGAK